jgi:clan AA aspartic protease (TIGR02281 family)
MAAVSRVASRERKGLHSATSAATPARCVVPTMQSPTKGYGLAIRGTSWSVNTTRRLIAGLSLVMLATLPAVSETIQLEQLHGVFMLPVWINDAVTVPFVLDSGAAEVAITEDVFSTLRRTGTVKDSDFIGTGTYTLADGSITSSARYVLHKMSVGNHVITDVVANVVSAKGDPLLGQSFLSKLPAWAIDNNRHMLVLHDQPEAPSGRHWARLAHQERARVFRAVSLPINRWIFTVQQSGRIHCTKEWPCLALILERPSSVYPIGRERSAAELRKLLSEYRHV